MQLRQSTELSKKEYMDQIQGWYRPDLVCVNRSAVNSFTSLGQTGRIAAPSSFPKFGGYATPESSMAFLIIRAALSFQFWAQDEAGAVVEFSRFDLPGAHALHRTILRLWGESPSTDALRFALSKAPLETLLGADIPALQQRAEVLESLLTDERLERIATVLSARIEKKGCVDFRDVIFLSKALPVAFDDPFYHKANLCLALYANLRNRQKSPIELDLLISTDYYMAAVLREMGLLTYSPELSQVVDSEQLIEQGSKEERAIRAAVVVAAQAIGNRLNVAPHILDQVLWRTRHLATRHPHHLTVTTAY